MPSSIFSSEYLRDYAKLPRAQRAWFFAVAGVLVAVALICHRIPGAIFGNSGCEGGTLGTAAIESLSDKTAVLFVGSSHVLFGVRPPQYSMPVMNLASAWLDYTCAKRIVEKHLRRVPNLEIAIIELDELPLMSNLVPSMIAVGDMRPVTDLSVSALEMPTDSVGEKVQAVYTEWMFPIRSLPRLTPLGWNTQTDICAPLQHPPKGFSAGYYYTEGVTPIDFNRKIVFDALKASAQNERVIARNFRALQDMVALLRSRAVTVVLLRLPHAPQYVAGRPALVTARWQLLQQWARTQSAADDGIVIWDRGEDPEFQAHDFVDDHHLNVFGADKLARLLDPNLRLLCRQARNRSGRTVLRLSEMH